MKITPEQRHQYLDSRVKINRESARRVLQLNGQALNQLLAEYGFVRDHTAGKKRYKKVKVNTRADVDELDRAMEVKPEADIFIKQARRDVLVIVSYLVGSKVFVPFWNTLLSFVKLHGAELVVLPMRYHNPTVLQEAIKQDEEQTIDSLVVPYLNVHRFRHGFATVLADIKINPTNTEPLNTLTSFSYGTHLIVGHTTQQIKPLLTGKHEKTLTAWSTGSCSVPELSDSLAGKKAELHHRYGFIVLGKNHLRSIHATRKGDFVDRGMEYAFDNIKPCPPLACVMGDLHIGQHDKGAYAWALGLNKERNNQVLLMNDSFDGSTVNHHEKNLYDRTRIFDFVSQELNVHRNFMDDLRRQGFYPFLVHSNHTDFLFRWANETSRNNVHSKDLEVYDKLNSHHVRDELLLELLGCETLPEDEMISSFRIKHGHEPFNGARGSIKSYNQTGTRTAYGHTHKVESLHGHENVGCLCLLNQPYMKGFSSAIHSIGFIYPNGKFQHEIKWS